MKTISIIIFAAIALLIVCFYASRKTATDKQQHLPTLNTVQESNPGGATTPENSTQQVSIIENTSFPPSEADIVDKYKKGLISKDEAMLEIQKRRFNQPQSFFGKLIDQEGNPVVGASITGTIETLNALQTEVQTQTFETESDSAGLFEFTGKTGAPIKIGAKKEGYLIGGHGNYYQGPPGEKTSPYERAILTMWKRRGVEQLTSCRISTKIPHDGTVAAFDIATGKQSPSGELRVTLTQYPLEVKKGWEKFDWSLKVEILNGGLIEQDDPYPYWAPANGYQPSFEFSESTNAVKWLGGLEKKLFIKTTQGKYGIMRFGVYPGRSPTGIEADITINPSGSQNLEPKQ